MFNLKGKIAVVTGSGSGIGKAVALLFAKQGAQVCVLDLNEEACNATVTEIKNTGGDATMYVCNVSVQQQVKEIFEKISTLYFSLFMKFQKKMEGFISGEQKSLFDKE